MSTFIQKEGIGNSCGVDFKLDSGIEPRPNARQPNPIALTPRASILMI
jgi:hypothetical protein